MTTTTRQVWENGKRRIERRLDTEKVWAPQDDPMFSASNIHYEMAERSKAISCGGVGVMLAMARNLGLIDAINEELRLLKAHLPYFESDHVLNIAFNVLAGGRCLEDIELLRNDESYMNALGAERIPDPTTAGDFCRRFSEDDILKLQEAVNQTRVKVWQTQPIGFFDEALIDMDGSLVETSGETKEGMDIAYNGTWGYHPLLISLANTQEVLYLANRSGNRPSHDGAAEYVDHAIGLVREAGFEAVTLRGDTDYSQTEHLDRWDESDVRFVFGYDCRANLKAMAESLPKSAWEKLERPEKYTVKTEARTRPSNVKERIVKDRGFKNLVLKGESVAEFTYQPTACTKAYRMVVLRKRVAEYRGQLWLLDSYDYFFYITNDWIAPAAFIVYDANQRCNQENIFSELKSGMRALHAPVNGLVSNWAYMVMASMAWSFKAWFALLLSEEGRWAQKHAAEKKQVLRMSFRTFLNYFMLLPTQVIRQGRKIIYRVLCWNPMLSIFLRGWNRIRLIPQLC